MLLTTSSERQGRVIDHDQSASMEKKKQEGTSDGHVSDMIEKDIEAYLHAHEHKSLLRFITAAASTTARAP